MMVSPVEPSTFNWFMDYIWVPASGAILAFATFITKKVSTKASKQSVEDGFRNLSTDLKTHIAQDRDNFIELFRKVELNKDNVNDKFDKIIEKMHDSETRILDALSRKADRRSIDRDFKNS